MNDVQSEFSPVSLPLMTLGLFWFIFHLQTYLLQDDRYMQAVPQKAEISCSGKEGILMLRDGTWKNASMAAREPEKGI